VFLLILLVSITTIGSQSLGQQWDVTKVSDGACLINPDWNGLLGKHYDVKQSKDGFALLSNDGGPSIPIIAVGTIQPSGYFTFTTNNFAPSRSAVKCEGFMDTSNSTAYIVCEQQFMGAGSIGFVTCSGVYQSK